LGLSLPSTAEHIIHLEHYGEKTALEAFNPVIGFKITCRALVDHLLLGTLGISGVALPAVPVVLGLVVLTGAAAWWWRRASEHRLFVLGIGCIGISDLLIYSARSAWSYDEQVYLWIRYNLFPHLGLTLFLCGGLQPQPGPFSRRQIKTLVL